MTNEPDFTVEEVQRMLRPFHAGGFNDCSIWYWADGRVNVDCRTKSGTELKGKGRTLRECMQKIALVSADITDAISLMRPPEPAAIIVTATVSQPTPPKPWWRL